MKRNSFVCYTAFCIVALLLANCNDDSQPIETKQNTTRVDKAPKKKKASRESNKKKPHPHKTTDSDTEQNDAMSELSFQQKCTLLLRSARDGDEAMLQKLIEAGAYLNYQDERQATALHYATAHPACLKRLLQTAEIDINTQDKSGLTPLNYAICSNECNIKSVQLLLDAPGIDVNLPDDNKYSPLSNAIVFKKKECAELLLNSPALVIDAADKKFNTSRIAEKGMPEIAELLRKKLVERAKEWLPKQSRHEAVVALAERRGIKSADYKTSIYQAIQENDTELLFRLIAAEADINIEENGNVSPLYKAAELGKVDCVRLLLAAPSIRTHSWSPINLAIISDNSEQFKELCTSPQNVNQADSYGDTPLHWAANLGKHDMLQALLEVSDQAVNTPDAMKNTPLHLAAQNGHAKCVRLLLNIPTIKVNSKTKYSESTPLMRAAGEGHAECVQLLLNSPEIDINQVDSMKYTALHTAVDEGRIECVRLLLAAPNIKINKRTEDGCTPLSLAKEANNEEIITLLQNAGAK